MVGAFASFKTLPFFYAAFDEDPWLLDEVVLGVKMEQRHENIYSDEIGLVEVVPHMPRTDVTIIDNPRVVDGYLPPKRFPDITLPVDGTYGIQYLLNGEDDDDCVYVMFKSLHEPLVPVAVYDIEGNGGYTAHLEWVGHGEVEGRWYMVKADNMFHDDGGRRSWTN